MPAGTLDYIVLHRRETWRSLVALIAVLSTRHDCHGVICTAFLIRYDPGLRILHGTLTSHFIRTSRTPRRPDITPIRRDAAQVIKALLTYRSTNTVKGDMWGLTPTHLARQQ